MWQAYCSLLAVTAALTKVEPVSSLLMRAMGCLRVESAGTTAFHGKTLRDITHRQASRVEISGSCFVSANAIAFIHLFHGNVSRVGQLRMLDLQCLDGCLCDVTIAVLHYLTWIAGTSVPKHGRLIGE